MNYDEQEAKTIETYDHNAQQWTKAKMANEWEREAKHLKDLLPNGSVIELGCGGGRDAAELIKLGLTYFGTDASAGMISAAQKSVPQGTFRQLNIYDLAKLKKKFDGFWACAVLLHIPKKRINEALQSISSVLKPGAMGMVSIKAGDKEDFEVREHEGMHEERLFVYWQKDDFETVLKQNGFRVTDYSYRPVSERTNWHVFFVKKFK